MSFSKIHNVSNIQLRAILMARFIMILICTQYLFSPCRIMVSKYFNKYLSLMKTVRYLIKYSDIIIELINEINNFSKMPGESIVKLSKYCTYDKRNDRLNYGQHMEELFGLS